jgi:hypothetical protein
MVKDEEVVAEGAAVVAEGASDCRFTRIAPAKAVEDSRRGVKSVNFMLAW